MYKVHSSVPKTMNDIFPISNSKYNLRNKDFSIPRVNTTKYGKHSIRYLGPYLWSKININLRQKTTLEAFKDAIRGMDIKGLLDGSWNCQVYQYWRSRLLILVPFKLFICLTKLVMLIAL